VLAAVALGGSWALEGLSVWVIGEHAFKSSAQTLFATESGMQRRSWITTDYWNHWDESYAEE
jgi:NADPH-dependent ferric siderophore reductase